MTTEIPADAVIYTAREVGVDYCTEHHGIRNDRSEQTYATEAEAEAVANAAAQKLHDVLAERGIRWADRARPGRHRR